MLHIRQGDLFEFTLTLLNIDFSLISKVEFISEKLNLQEIAELDGEIYRVRIEGARTRNFPLGFAKYFIVVTLIDGEELTPICDKVEVLARVVKNE